MVKTRVCLFEEEGVGVCDRDFIGYDGWVYV